MADLEVVEGRIWALLEPYREKLEGFLGRLYQPYREHHVNLTAT